MYKKQQTTNKKGQDNNMCVIASIPAGKTIDDKTFEQMWSRNPDGGGIAYITDSDKIEVFKSMDEQELLAQYKVISKKHGNHDMLIHMRIATHGSVCMDNNHPFWIDPHTVFAHNGILPSHFHPSAKSDLSDTRYFNQVYLQYVKPVAFDDEGFREQLGEIIGFNKLVILSTNAKLRKESYIINERQGDWENGVWYSNTHHLPQKTFIFGGGTSKNKTTKSKTKSQSRYQLDLTSSTDKGYMINPELYADPDFAESVQKMLDYTGFKDVEDMLIEYEMEVNPITGDFVCLACGQPVGTDATRACLSDCWASEMLGLGSEYDDQQWQMDSCDVRIDVDKIARDSK